MCSRPLSDQASRVCGFGTLAVFVWLVACDELCDGYLLAYQLAISVPPFAHKRTQDRQRWSARIN